MEENEKIRQTLDHIDHDKLVAGDPFFTTRLMARAEHYFSRAPIGSHSMLWTRLKPLMAAAVFILAIFAGIFTGTRLERIAGKATNRSELLRQYASEEYITGINGTVEEEILSSKYP